MQFRPIMSIILVGKTGVRMVAKLVQRRIAGKVNHGWWAAKQHNGIVLGRKQVGGDHFLIDEANAILPT